MKEKGDQFDTMFEAEEKIRLGEAGWKERYYQVRAFAACCAAPAAVASPVEPEGRSRLCCSGRGGAFCRALALRADAAVPFTSAQPSHIAATMLYRRL